MFFSEIIGHSTLKNQLRSLASSGRIPHAMLFLGPEGAGGLPLALTFAQYLLCENRAGTEQADTLFGANPQILHPSNPQPEPCGTCRGCVKSAKLVHPDLHFSYPTVKPEDEKGENVVSTLFLPQWREAVGRNPWMSVFTWLQFIGAGNRQGNITKAECNDIIRKLSLKTFESRYKIILLWMPEYLAREGNRLLKILEEPPPDTIFLLVAENQEAILPTILSRCQLLRVNPLSDEEVKSALVERYHATPETAESVAFMADGNFAAALNMLESEREDSAGEFLDWLRKCYKGHGVELVQWTDKMAGAGRENQKFFLVYGLQFLREFLALKMTGSPRLRLRKSEIETAQNLAKVLDVGQVAQMATLFSESAYHIERNANPKVLFLDTSIQLNKIMKRK